MSQRSHLDYPRVIDQDVDTAKMTEGLFHHSGNLTADGEIAGNYQNLSAASLDVSLRRHKFIAISREQHDSRTLSCQQPRKYESQPTRPATDDHHLVCERIPCPSRTSHAPAGNGST